MCMRWEKNYAFDMEKVIYKTRAFNIATTYDKTGSTVISGQLAPNQLAGI